jgi:hypothetical protein
MIEASIGSSNAKETVPAFKSNEYDSMPGGVVSLIKGSETRKGLEGYVALMRPK